MNVNFQLQKEEKTFSVAAFGRVLAAFLNKDVYEYRNDVDTLIEKLLMLEPQTNSRIPKWKTGY